MQLVTTLQMKNAEEYAINDKGVPSILLMENAAIGAKEEIMKLAPKNVAIFSGKGNNGGDGLAIARALIASGVSVTVYFVGEPEKATLDCNTNYCILSAYNTKIIKVTEGLKIDLSGYDVIVDALVGTGLKKKLSPKYAELANLINAASATVVAIDCPSGINADTGWDYGTGVYADITVTFHRAKLGLYLYPAYEHVGKIVVKSIGIPVEESEPYTAFVLDEIKGLLPKRKANTHKGSYGKAVFVSGCDTMAGAAVFNALSAYKVGAGLVNVCTTSKAIDIIHTLVPEAITTFREEYASLINTRDTVIACGSGLGRECDDIVYELIKKYKGTLVLDADALNAVSENIDILKERSGACIITPHIKEMARLTGSDTATVADNMPKLALEMAKKYNIIVMLKSAHTVIASPTGDICINITGCSALAKGGSGDCLTGIVTGLCAQGMDPFEAACLGAYIFGKAGERAGEKYTMYGTTAREVIDEVPNVIAEI